jgi:hypothetical protein
MFVMVPALACRAAIRVDACIDTGKPGRPAPVAGLSRFQISFLQRADRASRR